MCASRIANGLNIGEASIVVTLDLAKAFDSVWLRALIYKLKNLGISTPLVMFYASFLSGQTMSALVNGKLSTRREVGTGVPQGASSSPVLFLCYQIGLPKPLHRLIKSLSFADDFAINCDRPFGDHAGFG